MATNEEDDETAAIKDPIPVPRTVSKDEEDRLRRFLRFHRYAPIKLKHGKFHIHFWYFLVMILQFAKIVLITIQIIKFAGDRSSFSSVVNRGQLTLRHLLLKSWDSSREIPPYPPAQGDFAMYDVNNLLEELNHAVEAYYNIENDAIGFYKLYNNGTVNDGMTIRMKYFDFPGFDDGVELDSELAIIETKVRDDIGLTSTVDPKTNKTTYTYNITEAFEVMNLTEPIKRLLTLDLIFSFLSVRVYTKSRSALCLHIEGTVSFRDEDNNGQVLVNLVTSSQRRRCSDINISAKDVDFDTGYEAFGIAVIILCACSFLISLLSVFFGIYVSKIMAIYSIASFYDNKTELPTNEWVKYFTFLLWDLFLIVSDVLSIIGTIKLALLSWTSYDLLYQFDTTAMKLSIGGLLSYVYILKIFQIHHNCYILFKILIVAFSKILSYLICISVLFFGYFLCGYVVLGPYHVKFATASATIETLFSISNGDEIFATLANMEYIKGGSDTLWFFSRVYIYSFVALFAVIILNIIIAIFNGAQDAIEDNRKKRNEKLEFVSLEKALYKLRTTNDNQHSSILRKSLFEALEDGENAPPEIMIVKAELEKVWEKTGERNSKISKPVEMTLKSIMMGTYLNSGYEFRIFRFVIHVLPIPFICSDSCLRECIPKIC